MNEKFYIPVEVIEERITLLKAIQEVVSENEMVAFAINNLQLIAMRGSRVSSYKIGQQYIDDCYIEDAKYSVAWMTDDGVDEVPNDIDWDYEELAEEYSRRLENYASYLWQDVVKDYAYEHAKENE